MAKTISRSFRSVLLCATVLLLIVPPNVACTSSTEATHLDPIYHANSTFEPKAQRVILFSFDGLRPDALDKAHATHLKSLQTAGRYSHSAKSVLPSITLINHASMISGVGPATHGIDWNSHKPEKGTIRVPTIFDLAKKNGLFTAMISGKEKFRHFNRPGTIDRLVIQDGSADQVAEEAIQILTKDKPQLMLVHFRHADSEGHSHGWMSTEQIKAIEKADQAMGRVLYALKDLNLLRSTAILVTADHGGSDKSHGSNSKEDTTIPWIAAGAKVCNRGALNKKIHVFDTAATAITLLKIVPPANWDGKNILTDTVSREACPLL